MAGVAGTLWALLFRGVSFITGFLPGIKAFTAAVLGGIGNLGGAMAGGVLLDSSKGSVHSSCWPVSVYPACRS